MGDAAERDRRRRLVPLLLLVAGAVVAVSGVALILRVSVTDSSPDVDSPTVSKQSSAKAPAEKATRSHAMREDWSSLVQRYVDGLRARGIAVSLAELNAPEPRD